MDKKAFLSSDDGKRIKLGAFHPEVFLARGDVELTKVSLDVRLLGDAYRPWYYLANGGRHQLMEYVAARANADARSMRVSQLEIYNLHPERQSRIERYMGEHRGGQLPRAPLILAEDIETHRTLILDGNHTASALYRNHLAGVEYGPIPAYLIRGFRLDAMLGDMVIVNRG
jgi:hypothetical protein